MYPIFILPPPIICIPLYVSHIYSIPTHYIIPIYYCVYPLIISFPLITSSSLSLSPLIAYSLIMMRRLYYNRLKWSWCMYLLHDIYPPPRDICLPLISTHSLPLPPLSSSSPLLPLGVWFEMVVGTTVCSPHYIYLPSSQYITTPPPLLPLSPLTSVTLTHHYSTHHLLPPLSPPLSPSMIYPS